MATVIGISGALRRGSFNSALLRAAAESAPPGLTIEIASIREIPLYDGDVEAAEGVPAAVTALKDRIANANGLLLVTPEYNGSIPGVFKNAIDWLSRPPKDIARVFADKPTAVMGASPGPWGTAGAQVAWLQVLRVLGVHYLSGVKLQVPHAGKVFDAEGHLIDDGVRASLAKFLTGFAKHLGA